MDSKVPLCSWNGTYDNISATFTSTVVDKVALETALEKEGVMPLCIAQCMTIGAPQSGKSSLKRRLLKQTGQPNKSTGVAEKPVVSAESTLCGL